MAIGKAGVQINIDKLSIKFGDLFIIQGGKLSAKLHRRKSFRLYEK